VRGWDDHRDGGFGQCKSDGRDDRGGSDVLVHGKRDGDHGRREEQHDGCGFLNRRRDRDDQQFGEPDGSGAADDQQGIWSGNYSVKRYDDVDVHDHQSQCRDSIERGDRYRCAAGGISGSHAQRADRVVRGWDNHRDGGFGQCESDGRDDHGGSDVLVHGKRDGDDRRREEQHDGCGFLDSGRDRDDE